MPLFVVCCEGSPNSSWININLTLTKLKTKIDAKVSICSQCLIFSVQEYDSCLKGFGDLEAMRLEAAKGGCQRGEGHGGTWFCEWPEEAVMVPRM